MDYIYIVYYSESNYDMPSFIRAFHSKESAEEYIEQETKLNPKIGSYLEWESMPLDPN